MTKYAVGGGEHVRTAHVMTGKTQVHIYTLCGVLLLKSASRTSFELGKCHLCSDCESASRPKFLRMKRGSLSRQRAEG
jgi:hypothetical protein